MVNKLEYSWKRGYENYKCTYRSVRTDNEEVRADAVVEEFYEKSYKFHTTILIIIRNTLAESIFDYNICVCLLLI